MEEKRPKRKKKLEVAPPGFEPASKLPLGQYASPHTTGPCEHYLVLPYFSLPFTLFEPCGAGFIMNSKIHARKNSLNEYFKTPVSHYFVFIHFRALYRPLD